MFSLIFTLVNNKFILVKIIIKLHVTNKDKHVQQEH